MYKLNQIVYPTSVPGGLLYSNFIFIAMFFRTVTNLSDLLSNCDYVCNVLPNTPQTQGLLDGNALEDCKSKVILSQ